MNQKQQTHNNHGTQHAYSITTVSSPTHVRKKTERETQYEMKQRIPELRITLLSMYACGREGFYRIQIH
jgi:hypothetical protein